MSDPQHPPTVSDTARARLLALLAARQTQAASVQAPASEVATPPGDPIPRVMPGQVARLSYAQEALWFIEQLVGSTALYNVIRATRLEGPLNVAALDHSWRQVVLRHDSLRTRILTREGQAELHVSASVDGGLTVIDASACGPEELETLMARQANQPIDLVASVPWRVTLFRLDEEKHVLLMVIHHIVCDGWSLGVLARELARFYAEATIAYAPDKADVAPLALQFADFAAWQRQRFESGSLAHQMVFWRRQLAGITPVELPTDRARPPRLTERGATLDFVLPAALRAQLGALAQSRGVTLFMLLLTAYKVLLKRLAAQDDVAVGSPVAGRNRAEFEDQVGYFVNSLVLRTDLGGKPSFAQALDRVRQTTLDAFDHQDLPFDRIVADLSPERDLSRNPLYQVSFALQSYPSEKVELPGLHSELLQLAVCTSKFDLSLSFTETAGQLAGVFEYSTDLFDTATIERWRSHLFTLLQSVVAYPDLCIDEVPLLTPEQRDLILVQWNDTRQTYALSGSVHALVEAQVARSPHAVAVALDAEVLDYATLNAKADAVAHLLRARGVGPDVLVGVCMERSFELLIGLLGVLKAGGAFMPMDPELPADRLAFMLDDAEAPVVLTQAHLHSRLVEIVADKTVALVPVAWRDLSDQADPIPQPAGTDPIDDLAYAIFTSGSTGRPKGALNTHRGLVNHVLWLKDALRLSVQDRVAHKTTISFDAAIWEIFTPLVCGASVVLARPGVHRDMQALTDFVIEQSVSVLQMVPSALRVLLSESRISECTNLRYVVSGGEALEATLAQQFRDTLPHAVLGNFYGPSEASDDATWFELGRVLPDRPIVPIGRPIGNVRCHVLDTLRQPVPIGVVGELLIGGESVGRGYLKRPELTAEKFIDDPFQPGRKLYRSGDLARYLPDGNIEYVGRIDHQVKIRGQRVELGEIEAQLKTCTGVTQSAVLLREDRAGHPQLVAYVVAEPSSVANLKTQLGKMLPAHMVPSTFIRLEVLPTLPNGKLDRKSLPAPEATTASVEVVGARSPLEELLLEIWASVLPANRFGIHDNFFDLGGHSLIATRIAARARAQLHEEVPLSWLFECPTVAELAARIEQSRQRGAVAVRPVALSDPRERPLSRRAPVSFAQRRMWLLQQREPGSAAYNMALAYRLTGALEPNVLHAALHDMVSSHEAFRTSFEMADEEPVQVIQAPGPLALDEIDLSALSARERDERLASLMRERARRPFNLSSAPLYRFALIRLAPTAHVLLLVMHHAIGDEWSVGILMRQLSRSYRLRCVGELPSVAPVPLEYADYAIWQRAQVDDRALDTLWAYWRDRLAGIQPLALPYDRPPPRHRSSDGDRVTTTLPVELIHRLREFSVARAVTPSMTLMAAFAVLLRAYTRQDDITIGSPVANRTTLDAEELVGVMVNTLMLRHDTSGQPTFNELLHRVRACALSAYAHQDMPYDLLVERLRAERGGVPLPDLQVMFNVLNTPAEPPDLAGLQCQPEPIDRGTAQLDLSLQVDLEYGREVVLTFASDVFEASTAQRWLAAYLHLVDELLTRPERRISDVVAAEPLERQTLAAWNATQTAYDQLATAHQALARQVQRNPLATALRHGNQTLTYAELEVRSNRLARLLRSRGARRGMLVGLCVERTPDMVVAQLAVLKAGAAYVPLDPAYPSDRLAHMASDARLGLLVTQATLAALVSWPRDASIWLDEDAADLAQLAGHPLEAEPEHDARPDDAAYVIYTSGSTGKPKGVVVPHTAVVNFLESMAREPGLCPSDRLVAVTTLSFDIAVLELLLPLSVGAQIVLAPREVAVDGRALRQLVESSQATVMQATPSTWRMLIEAGWRGHAGFKALIGGEPLPRDLAEALLERTGSLWNLYGPTETTVWSTLWHVDDLSQGIGIGRPIANTQVQILDEQLRPCPIGAVGEICIGGAGVTSGYLHRPELTAERFVAHPLATSPSRRLYRTGDLGRWRSDGTLEHLGRMDTQVKVRGHRIELGEIESALASHPEVVRSVVTTFEPMPGDVRLVAYIVCTGTAPSATAVRDHLAATLPAHMLPQHVVVLDSIPLLPNGKVDRRSLPPPAQLGPEAPRSAQVPAEPPANEMEATMVALWQRLLGLEKPPGVTQSFFDLGGHSLLAARLVRAVEQEFGHPCGLQQLYRAPSVRALCAELPQPQREDRAEVIALSDVAAPDSLYCICGVQLYKPLADVLAGEYRVYGIFLPYEQRLLERRPGEPVRWPTVEQMAADYVTTLLEHQPQGPYRLAGVSFGGVLAFEMAQQLRRAGHEVAFVGLFDTMLPGSIERAVLPRVGRATGKLLRRLLSAPGTRLREPVAESLDPVAEAERRVGEQREAIYLRAIRAYRPERYDGLVLLARAQDLELQAGEVAHPSYRWGAVIPELQVVDVPGNHIGLLTSPHVEELAARLRPRLQRATDR